MSWKFGENVATNLAAGDKNRAPRSDSAHADDNCPMSDDQGARSAGTALNEPAYHARANKESGKTGASMSNLIESTRQQRDRDFFEKFLRNPAKASAESGAEGHQAGSQQAATTQQQQLAAGSHQASLIDQLLPQVATTSAHQSALLRSSSYLLDPMHSSSAGYGLANPAANYQQRDENSSSLEFVATTTTASANDSNPPLYGGINLIAGQHLSPSAAFNGMGVNSLFYNLNNQLNASDSSNVFSGNSESFSAGDYAREDPFQSRQVGGVGRPSTSSKTYSSVLHPISQQAGLAAMQPQQQQLVPDGLTLFDIQQKLAATGLQSILGANAANQQQLQRHLTRDSSRSFNEFLIGQQQQQQQQQQQALVCQRNQTFPTQHHQQNHPAAKTSSIYQRQQHQRSGATPGASAAAVRQMAVGNAATGGTQMRNNTTPLAQKASDSSFAGSAATGAAGTRRNRNKSPFFSSVNYLGEGQPGFKLDVHGTGVVNSEESERFSRKVFVGGLPPDIDEEEIKASFRRFGALVVDWPHKAESKSYFPPKGYAFLLFQEESSVQALIDSCFQEEDKLYLCVSSPTIKDKPVQIRPWRLNDSDFVLDSTLTLDPRKTVFVGGVPRPLKASELATIMNNLYGGVCYAGIDTDPELKYPKGAGRVAFSNYQSYIAAISARFVHIHHSEIEKRVEVKPYVLDDQYCDECQGSKCNNKFAPFFCANITCLRYYCDNCWSAVHSQPGKEFHKPLVKEGGDRPRGTQSFKW